MAAKRGLPGIVIGGCWDQTAFKEIFEEDCYDIVTGYNFHWVCPTQAGEPGTYNSLAKGHLFYLGLKVYSWKACNSCELRAN